MRIDATIESQIRWPRELVKSAKAGGTFARGTPGVGTRLLKQVAALVMRGIKDNIKKSRSARGNLASLSNKTIDEKRRMGVPYPTKPLRRKGVLYRAIHYYKSGPNEGVVSIIPRGRYGTKTKLNARQIAEEHINGTYGGPKRDFWFIHAETKKNVDEAIRREFDRLFRRADLAKIPELHSLTSNKR